MISDQLQDPHQDQHHDQAQRLADSARYALLRRLAPALRHNLAGALQPLKMMSALLEKRLQNPDPDIAAVRKNSSQLNKAASEASKGCMDVMTWLAPSVSDMVSVTSAIEDAAGLVMNELSFKGTTLANKVGDLPAELSRSLTRNVFLAALLALTDTAVSQAIVVIEASLEGAELVLTLSMEAGAGEPLTSGGSGYRKLDWADVKAIAEVETVQLTHTANVVELRFHSQLVRLN